MNPDFKLSILTTPNSTSIVTEVKEICPNPSKLKVLTTMAEPGPIIRSGGRVSSVCGGIRAIKNCKIDKAFKCPFQACATTDKKPARVLQHVQKVHMGDVVIEHPSQVYDYLNSKLRNPVIEKVFVQRLKWVDGTGSNKLFPVTVPSQFDILLTSTRKAKKNDSDQRLPGAPDDVRYDENGPGGDPVFQNEAIMRSIAGSHQV